MGIGAFLLVLTVLILVGLYLYAPFLDRRRASDPEVEHEASVLMAERDRVINALRDLDFDAGLGKIPAEDYPAQRALLVQKGAEIWRRLDELPPSVAPPHAEDRLSRIENAASSRRPDAPSRAALVPDDEVESLIAERRRLRKERSAGFCPRCGRPVQVSDRFCPACGKSLQ